MGTNNLVDQSDGSVIDVADINQYKTAFVGDIVPRNSSGVATNDAGDLGQDLIRWQDLYLTTSLEIGTSGSSIVANSSGIVPAGDDTQALGSASLTWSDVYAQNVVAETALHLGNKSNNDKIDAVANTSISLKLNDVTVGVFDSEGLDGIYLTNDSIRGDKLITNNTSATNAITTGTIFPGTTNLMAVSINPYNRKVLVTLQFAFDGIGAQGGISITGGAYNLSIRRGGTTIYTIDPLGGTVNYQANNVNICFVDTGATGTSSVNYSLAINFSAGNRTITSAGVVTFQATQL